MYKLYNSYFVFWENVVMFVIVGFLEFYIYIYYTCRSLTRVGRWVSRWVGRRRVLHARPSGSADYNERWGFGTEAPKPQRSQRKPKQRAETRPEGQKPQRQAETRPGPARRQGQNIKIMYKFHNSYFIIYIFLYFLYI